jgi:hypothetical protein
VLAALGMLSNIARSVLALVQTAPASYGKAAASL